MENKSFSKSFLGILVFSLGILLSTALTTALTWANFEADSYGFQRYGSDRFDGLTCPVLMSRHETGTVRVQVENSTKKSISPVIRIDTSTRGIPDRKQIQITIPPGQSQWMEQKVTADNIDLGFFVFAKAYRYPSYPLPAAEAVCGTMVFDLPFLNGMQLYMLWLVFSLVAIPLGLWLFSSKEYGKINSSVKALALIALAGLLLSARAGWLLGLACLVLTILLFSVILLEVAHK